MEAEACGGWVGSDEEFGSGAEVVLVGSGEVVRWGEVG